MSRIIYLRQEKRKRGRKRGDLRHEARAVRLTRPEMITENKRQARTLEAPKSMGGRGRPYQMECPSLLTLCAGFGAWVRFFGFKQELEDEMDDAREKRTNGSDGSSPPYFIRRSPTCLTFKMRDATAL